VGEVIGQGWDLFKQHWVPLVFTMFLGGIIGQIPGVIPSVMQASGSFKPDDPILISVNLVTSLLGFAIGQFFNVGYIKMWLTAIRGGTPQFGDMFSGGSRALPAIGAMFLTLIAFFLGYAACIVPGVIVALGLSFTQFFVVDQNMGPIDAMSASWRVTQGHRGNIFVFGLASVGIILLGLCACIVGVYPAIVVVSLAFAIIYMRLTGQAQGGGGPSTYGGGYAPPAPGGFGAAPPAGGFGGPPAGGGYGPPPGGGGGYGGPPPGGGGGYGGPPPAGGGYGPPPGGGGGYGPPPGGGGGYGPPPGGGGGYGGPQGGGGYGGPQGGGGPYGA
jgi:hypothetical protein